MRVVYANERIFVVDKPAGVSAEDVAAALGKKLVHRIDKATSGLLVLAEDARTVQRLQRSLAAGVVERAYLLVAHGVVASGRIASELVDDRGDGLRGSGAGGKPSVTDVEVLAVGAGGRATFARALLHTGRTHQIRIHFAEAGHPLVGERVYIRDRREAGLPVLEAPRLLLHAWRLCFLHPVTKSRVEVESPLPADFLDAAASVGVSCELTGARRPG